MIQIHMLFIKYTYCMFMRQHYGLLGVSFSQIRLKNESLYKTLNHYKLQGWCVLTFVFTCVFRENLERLLDDKHFKEEIVHFNISEETGVVDASHRVRLIPLLMRYV